MNQLNLFETETRTQVLVPIASVEQRKRLVKEAQETGQKLHEAVEARLKEKKK